MGRVWAPKFDWGDDGKHTVITESDSDQPSEPSKAKKVKKPKKVSKDRPSGRRR